VVCASAAAFISFKGKDIVVKYSGQYLGATPSIESVAFKLPFSVEIKKFNCPGLSFCSAIVVAEPFGLLSGKISLVSAVVDGLNVKITITKNKLLVGEGLKLEFPLPQEKESAGFFLPGFIPSAYAAGDNAVAVSLGDFTLRNAVIEVNDARPKEAAHFFLKDVDLRLKGFSFPALTRFDLDLTASLESRGVRMKDVVKANGWIDFAGKNMDVKVKVSGLDGLTLREYYQDKFDPQIWSLTSAIFSLDASLQSVRNELVLDAQIIADQFDFSPDGETSSRGRMLRTILAQLKGDKDKPTINVVNRNKMDPFDQELLKQSFGEAAKQKARDSFGNLVNLFLGETVKKGSEGVSDAVKGVKSMTVDTAVETFKGVADKFKNEFKDFGKMFKGEEPQTVQPPAEQVVPASESTVIPCDAAAGSLPSAPVLPQAADQGQPVVETGNLTAQ